MPYTLLMPMAGRGERFGGVCKPLLMIGNRTFAEEATAPFIEATPPPRRSVAGLLQVHDREHDARARLLEILRPLEGEVVLLPAPTAGPAQTVAAMIDATELVGPVVICDCDHALDVQPVVTRLLSGDAEAVVPTWPLELERIDAWCVAGLDGDRVVAVAEKSLPDGSYSSLRGVIGCYGFADARDLRTIIRATRAVTLSAVLVELITRGSQVVSVDAGWARFFGDPDRLALAESVQTPKENGT